MGMGGVLDSSRLAFAVCEQLGCAPADVTAWPWARTARAWCWPRASPRWTAPHHRTHGRGGRGQRGAARCVKGGASARPSQDRQLLIRRWRVHREDGGGHPHGFARGDRACARIDGQYGIEDLYMNVPVRLARTYAEEVVSST